MRCYYGDQTELMIWDCNINSEDIATILGSPNYNKPKHCDLIACNAFFQPLNKPLPPRRNVVSSPSSIRVTIGGIEQYIPFSDRFLNGDDLSENAYRLSRSQRPLPGRLPTIFHMRFGHTGRPIIPVTSSNIPSRFRLAHKVACDCYYEITGQMPNSWDLVSQEAIKP